MDKEQQRNELRHKIKQKERQRAKTSTRINEHGKETKKDEPEKSNIESMYKFLSEKQKENLMRQKLDDLTTQISSGVVLPHTANRVLDDYVNAPSEEIPTVNDDDLDL